MAALWTGERQRHWAAASPLGVVLDFAALRRWLAEEACSCGAALRLGWRVCSSQMLPTGLAQTELRGSGGRTASVTSRFVVDATGEKRALLGDPDPAQGTLISGSGVEWLLRVSPAQWQDWAGRLSFMLGSRWVPQGYGWVFPMQPGLLKLGVCRLQDGTRRQPPLHQLQHALLERLQLNPEAVLDRHGGLIRSTIRRLSLIHISEPTRPY